MYDPQAVGRYLSCLHAVTCPFRSAYVAGTLSSSGVSLLRHQPLIAVPGALCALRYLYRSTPSGICRLRITHWVPTVSKTLRGAVGSTSSAPVDGFTTRVRPSAGTIKTAVVDRAWLHRSPVTCLFSRKQLGLLKSPLCLPVKRHSPPCRVSYAVPKSRTVTGCMPHQGFLRTQW